MLAGKVAPQVLSFFDFNGEELLYHFRFLPAERRAAAAQYIATNTLDAPVSRSAVASRLCKTRCSRPGCSSVVGCVQYRTAAASATAAAQYIATNTLDAPVRV
jgi:hypothetical protein